MDLTELLKPNVPEDMAIDLIQRLYGLQVIAIKRMISFDDQNFHIKVSENYSNPHISAVSKDGYTFKITNTMRSAEEGHFDAMHHVMNYLHRKGLSVPFPVRNVKGETWTMEKVPLLNEGVDSTCPKLCGVHLLSFIPGAPVSTVKYTSDILYQWGLLLAKYHNAVEDMDYPDLLSKCIFWDLEHIPDLEKFIEGLEEHREKLVRSILNKYPSEVTQNIKNLPKGFIHGDFNENNVLVQLKNPNSDEKSYYVTGVLDFEDVHYGTYVWDVGVMLAYTLLECNVMDPLEGAGHALSGYLSLRSLSDLELSLLKTCIESRLCQSLVLCAFSYRQDPSNSYLLTSAKTGWTRLEQMCSITKEDLLLKWNEIRESYTAKDPQLF